MADRESNVVNVFQTTVTSEVSPTDLTFTVATTTNGPASPCYIVFMPDDDTQREIVWCDGTFTGTTFVTTSLSNRYLEGSAATSGLTHAVGEEVWCVPVAQHIRDLHDRINALQAALDTLEASLGDVTFSDESGTTYTLQLGDDGTVVKRFTNAAAVTVTIPTNAAVAFDIGASVELYAAGAGGVTFAGDTGVTVQNVGSISQYSTVVLTKHATNTWVATGPVLA